MKLEPDHLERLISRVLDGEATPGDRAQLDAAMRADSAARALYQRSSRIDLLAADVLNEALPRSTIAPACGGRVEDQPWANHPFFRKQRWIRRGQYVLGAAAACIAILAWLQPARSTDSREYQGPARGGMLPARSISGDIVAPTPSQFEHPEVRVRGTDREVILVPADKPGLYWMIEVDRERTHVVPVHKDF